MKKMICLVLCMVMVLAFGVTNAFAFDIIKPNLDLDPTEVKEFKALVAAIGEVTLEDKEAIEAAEAARDNLLDTLGEDKCNMWASFRDSRATLEEARTAYDALVAAQAPSEEIVPTGDGIFVMVALVALSAAALVLMVSKKRAF